MSSTPETISTQEVFKRVYADPLINAVPEFGVLQREIKFDAANKIGESYRFPIQLRYPHGHTWTGGNSYGTVVTLNDAIAGLTKQAEVKGCEYVLREQIAYGAVSKSATGEAAFDPIVDVTVSAVVESSTWALELATMHGGGSIGAIQTKTNGAGTTATLLLSAASWAPGNWSAFEGGNVDVYDSTLTTKRNANGPVSITAINIDSRELSVTFAAAQDRTDTVATDVLVPTGAYSNWQSGLLTTLSNSAAGSTVYGLNTSTYGLLRAGSYSAGSAALTFAKLANAAIRSVTKGGMGNLLALVSHYAWTDINNDEAANRRYTDDYGGEFKNGADKLSYYGPNGGRLDIMPHSMMPAGNAVLIDPSDWRRIGSSEPTFELPGRGAAGNPMFLLERQDQNAFEFRRWWDQAPCCRRLGRQVIITSIVNDSGP
jgi:hypothetical protein